MTGVQTCALPISQSRYVMIVPEIEIPGHSTAALAAYPQFSCFQKPLSVVSQWGVFKDVFCPGKEETFTFLQDVLKQVCDLFPSPYIHIGGDEAKLQLWADDPELQAEMKRLGCKDAHDNSMIACIAGVMQVLGEDELTYEYLMGVSGAAFRVQMMAEPTWCPSAACAPCGYDCVPGAVAATGYRLRWIDTQRDGKWLDGGVREALQAIPLSIDRGVPVIVAGKESGLVVGYHTDGKVVVRPYEFQQDGYQDAEVCDSSGEVKWVFGNGKWDDWVWTVGIVEPGDLPMDRRSSSTVTSLYINVLKVCRKE